VTRRTLNKCSALLVVAVSTCGIVLNALGEDSLESLKASYRRPDQAVIPAPAHNPLSAERIDLGKKLFFDPRLSGSGRVSCATCHSPSLSWGDGLPRSVGAKDQVLSRRSPTLLNIAWCSTLFWDGRAADLEEQAVGPVTNKQEMNQTLAAMLRSIRGPYRELFSKAYPGEPLNSKTVFKAIACFERSIVSGPAPFDRWVEGDESAISDGAKRGFILFNGKAKCSSCHSGWRFTDDAFYDIGAKGNDPGRGKLMPGFETMQHAFKTPTLRNVARRSPYLHDGSVANLANVIELYVAGGEVRRPSLSDQITPLQLSKQEKLELTEFLTTLTGADPPVTLPVLPQ